MKVELVYRMLGFRIEIQRDKLSLTQEQLAERVGLDRTSISNIENGNQRILVHDLFTFSKALEIKPNDLIKGIFEE